MQTLKYGAKSIICSYRTRPMEFNWPAGIEERPLLQKLDGKRALFKDGTTAEVDSIILCTGYQHWYPYLPDELRLRGVNEMYNPHLYKVPITV